MKNKTFFLRLAVLLSLLAGAARAGSFSADMIETGKGQTRTGSFHFVDGSYCFAPTDDGPKALVVFDAAQGVLRIIMSSEKAYRELKADDTQTALMNPFVMCTFAFPNSALRSEGTETIDGLPCTKRVLSMGGNDYFISWTSDEFGIPVRIEDRLTNRTIELRNLKRGPQDAALFTTHVGFELKGDPETEPPEWAANLAKAPRFTPPFEKTLNAGDVIRVALKAGFTIRVQATNPSSGDSTGVGLPFKDGRPLFNPRGETFTLQSGGEVGTGCTRTPEQADDYVFHVKAGRLALKMTYEPVGTSTKRADGIPPTMAESEAHFPGTPLTASVAARLELGWEGPNGEGDFIAIARADQPPAASLIRAMARDGSPAKLWAPSDPGEYELRYVAGGRPAKVLATAALTVEPATAVLNAQDSVAAAAPFEVEWIGPRTDGDFLSIAKVGSLPSAAEYRAPAKTGNLAKLRAPSDAGEYEVRYVLGRGSKLIAALPITVTPVRATVTPPTMVKVAAEFTVGWTGPGYEEDYLCVVAASTPANGSTLSAVRVSQGNPGKLRAPKLPGTYEVRYILGRGKRLLGKETITVEAP